MKDKRNYIFESGNINGVMHTVNLLGHGESCAICSLKGFSRKDREKVLNDIGNIETAIPNSTLWRITVKEIGSNFKDVCARIRNFLKTENEVERILNHDKEAC